MSGSTQLNRERYSALWARAALPGAPAQGGGALFDELLRLYGESHRHYHTANHVAHCLREFDAARPHLDEPDCVELAVWFHDAIFDARSADNEAASARFFRRVADGIMAPQTCDLVDDLIMVTTHKTDPDTNDERFIVDIDLSAFGLPWEQFINDSVAVRAECLHLTDTEFFPRHKAFVQSLLDREVFCYTEFFRARHEEVARRNIQRYLDCMAAKA